MRKSLLRLALTALAFALLSGCSHPVSKPPALASVTLRQAAARHSVIVGTAASSWHLSDADYTAILGSEFSELEPESEMKFAPIHPESGRYHFSNGDALVSFARAHEMLVRGHTLVWHRQVPTWVSSEPRTPSVLAGILQDHISTVVRHYAGKVYAWDVVNEALNSDGSMRSTLWYDHPGIGFAGRGTRYIEQAFEWAHAADPNAKLFYNDFDAEIVNAKSDAIYAMAKDFKNRGVPLNGIGFQFHIDLSFGTANNLRSAEMNLERFAKLGLELHITELDVRLKDSSTASLAAQEKLYGDVATLCVHQHACKVFQTWGFTDKYSWIPHNFPGAGWGLLWDASYQKKPAYEGVLKAFE